MLKYETLFFCTTTFMIRLIRKQKQHQTIRKMICHCVRYQSIHIFTKVVSFLIMSCTCVRMSALGAGGCNDYYHDFSSINSFLIKRHQFRRMKNSLNLVWRVIVWNCLYLKKRKHLAHGKCETMSFKWIARFVEGFTISLLNEIELNWKRVFLVLA